MQIRYVGLSNETPYGIMKFVQEAERDPRNPKIISVQVVYNSFLVQNISGFFFLPPLSFSGFLADATCFLCDRTHTTCSAELLILEWRNVVIMRGI